MSKFKKYFFGLISWAEVDEIAVLTFLGLPLYRRVGPLSAVEILCIPFYRRIGNVVSVMGITWQKKS